MNDHSGLVTVYSTTPYREETLEFLAEYLPGLAPQEMATGWRVRFIGFYTRAAWRTAYYKILASTSWGTVEVKSFRRFNR